MTNGTPEAPAREGSTARRAIFGLLAALALVGVAVGGYLVGHEAADADAAFDRGFIRGQRAESREFARGTPKYDAIYRDGYSVGRAAGIRAGEQRGERSGAERGRRTGVQRGEAIGRLEGNRAGIASGAAAALGGYEDWEAGEWYLVKLATGEQGVPFRVQLRKALQTDERYAICARNPADVCAEPIPGG
jgi:hypothetical protein